MPRRRHTGPVQTYLDPNVFLLGDGYDFELLSFTNIYPDRATAEAAWRMVFVDTWNIWAECCRAVSGSTGHVPYAARAFDDLEDIELIHRYDGVDVVAEAADRSRASVERYRQRRPRDAAEIAEHLELWELQLRLAVTEAEEWQKSGKTIWRAGSGS